MQLPADCISCSAVLCIPNIAGTYDCCCVSLYILWNALVTTSQNMREGVVKDLQRQEMKKIQNLKMLQDQIELTKILKERQQNESNKSQVREH